MSARGTASRSQSLAAKAIASSNPIRSEERSLAKVPTPSRPQLSPAHPGKSDPVFDPHAFLARAGLGRRVVNLKKNEVAYAQGDPADTLFYVQAGRLQVTVTSAGGKEATIALVGAKEFLGENCLVSAHPLRLETATAMTACALLRISKAEMVRIVHQEPQLAEIFVSFLLTRKARMQADLVDQLFNSSEKRLARILLLLAQFGKESKPDTVVPKISQEILAEMIGTTRSRVSFFMNRFRKLGFIEYNGEIRVHNTLLNIFLKE
jgi:CRP/FNR family cyclic AMP-dependent transcriptional regulator